MISELIQIGCKAPTVSPVDGVSVIKCEVLAMKEEFGNASVYIHYLSLNRRYDRWIDVNDLILDNPSDIEQPKKKKKDEKKKDDQRVDAENEDLALKNENKLIVEDQLSIKNIEK